MCFVIFLSIVKSFLSWYWKICNTSIYRQYILINLFQRAMNRAILIFRQVSSLNVRFWHLLSLHVNYRSISYKCTFWGLHCCLILPFQRRRFTNCRNSLSFSTLQPSNNFSLHFLRRLSLNDQIHIISWLFLHKNSRCWWLNLSHIFLFQILNMDTLILRIMNINASRQYRQIHSAKLRDLLSWRLNNWWNNSMFHYRLFVCWEIRVVNIMLVRFKTNLSKSLLFIVQVRKIRLVNFIYLYHCVLFWLYLMKLLWNLINTLLGS